MDTLKLGFVSCVFGWSGTWREYHWYSSCMIDISYQERIVCDRSCYNGRIYFEGLYKRKYLSGVFCQQTMGVWDHMKGVSYDRKLIQWNIL